MQEKKEVDMFWACISRSFDRIIACLDGLTEYGLDWRPIESANSLYVLAAHILGTTEENLLGVLCGQQVQRHREAEFAAKGVSAEPLRSNRSGLRARVGQCLEGLLPGESDRVREHPRRGMLTGRDVLLVVAGHAAEHMGQPDSPGIHS